MDFLNSKIFCLLVISILIRSEANIIESPRVTNRGKWGFWDNCQGGLYAIGFQLKTEAIKGWMADESALNGIRILCGKPGSRQAVSESSSIVGSFGNWGSVFYCEGLLTGFQLRSEKDAGDKTAANNLKGLCSSTTTERTHVIEGDGLDFGAWTAEQHCKRGEAICGIKTQVELGSSFKGWIGVDDTGLNNVDMKCCKINGERSSCKATDAWEIISICNNLNGTSDLTCSYEKTVGIVNSNLSRQGGETFNSVSGSQSGSSGLNINVFGMGLSKNFEQNLEVSKTTGHNWGTESSQTWTSEVKHTAQFTVRAGTLSILSQVVGHCGDYTVHTAHFKKDDK